jgi:cell division protein FtsI (penicillin-binding protein 3)
VPLEPSPISARTMADLRWLMWLTVEKGTATKAKQAAYLIGGKTGTADKAGEKKKGEAKGYRKGAVIASFVGVFPIEKPRYVVLAMLDEPQSDKSTHGFRYGGWTAAPVVGAIVDRMGPLLGIMPSEPTAQQALFDRLIVNKGAREGDERLAALGSRQ